MVDSTKRKLILALGGILVGNRVLAAQLAPTPAQTAGPFYPREIPLDDDSDLTRVSGRQNRAKGIISDVQGRIVDINGNPLSNLRIEIWQCDANGRYRHPGDDGQKPMDENFQGHGANLTNAKGQYRFRTIKPVAYPGRTPHIHVAVFAPGQRPFVTQLYVAGEARNERDFLYRRIAVEKRQLVTAEFTPSGNSDAPLQAEFNIILDRRDGTPLDS